MHLCFEHAAQILCVLELYCGQITFQSDVKYAF